MRAGGKQYRVERNQLLDVDRIQAEIGSIVELQDVLLVSGNGSVQVGTPLVDGARVIAEVVEHGRDKKIAVFKYKSKVRYRRRHGHRQNFTRLAVRGILGAGEEAEEEAAEKPKPSARKRPAARAKASKPAAEETEVTTASEVDAPEAEAVSGGATAVKAAAKPRARARTKASEGDATASAKPAKRTTKRKPKTETDESGDTSDGS